MADILKKFLKYGVLKTKITSRSVSWCVQNFFIIREKRNHIRSDFFKVSSLSNCLFYLTLAFEANKDSFIIQLNRCAYSNLLSKTSNFSASITIAFEDIFSILNLTRCFCMTADNSCVSSSYEQTAMENFCIDGDLHIFCSVTLTETELTASEKNCERIKNKIWSHCSVISSKELKEHIEILLDGDASNKVIISVDGETFPVHKNMLCSHSPVFSAMFSHESLENQQNIVHVNDIRKEVVGEMLKFIYTGCTSALSPCMNMELFIAADKYAISSLKERCSKFLAAALNEDLVLDVLMLAHQHSDIELKNTAMLFLTENASNLLESEEFLSFIGSECEIIQSILIFLVKQNAK